MQPQDIGLHNYIYNYICCTVVCTVFEQRQDYFCGKVKKE